MTPTLLIMAAGLGSRFGGVKQLAKVGPNGEAFLDLSIQDAAAAGFGRTVVITRADIESDTQDHIRRLHGNDAAENHPIDYVRQDDFGPKRQKPWGTMHAILSAADVLDQPFCVINADDYYGPSSFVLAAKELQTVSILEASTVTFEIGNTLPPSGSVSRGICEVKNENLVAVTEAETCERHSNGEITADGQVVPADTPVSMNMWCFHHQTLDGFFAGWETFLAANSTEEKAECQLPTVVSERMSENQLSVRAPKSPEQWIGVTNPEDLERAKQALGG